MRGVVQCLLFSSNVCGALLLFSTVRGPQVPKATLQMSVEERQAYERKILVRNRRMRRVRSADPPAGVLAGSRPSDQTAASPETDAAADG